MSPQSPGTTFFGRESYKSIDRPLVCLTGSRDTQKRWNGTMMLPNRRKEVLKLLPEGEKYFIWLANVDHLAFSDGPKAHFLPSRARIDAQRISKALMVVFCDYYLKDEKEAKRYMNEDYVKTLLGKVVDDVQWTEK